MAIAQANWEVEATATVSTEADKRTGWWHHAKSGSNRFCTQSGSFCRQLQAFTQPSNQLTHDLESLMEKIKTAKISETPSVIISNESMFLMHSETHLIQQA